MEVTEEKFTACVFAVKFSTTKPNIIVEQTCFQEVQNYASWLVLEKAYREKNVISPRILSRRLKNGIRTLHGYHT